MQNTMYVFRRLRWVGFLLLVLTLSVSSLSAAQDTQPAEPPAAEVTDNVVTTPPPDVTPPLIDQPLDLVIPAVDSSGAVVTFLPPVGTDNLDGPVTVTCDWVTGATFPLGATTVTCSAGDVAGNTSSVRFLISVVDQTPPVVTIPSDVYVVALDGEGAAVTFAVPSATDNVEGVLAATCDQASGAFFPIGATLVSCWATDSSGNTSVAAAFSVIVDPPPPTVVPPSPVPTVVPATQVPTPTPTPAGVVTPQSTLDSSPVGVGAGLTPTPPVDTSAAVTTPTPLPSETATLPPTVVPQQTVPAALALPWPLPGDITIDPAGGPLNGIDAIWGYQDFPVSQEFGHTEFSIINYSWYAYGTAYGLDGFEHPGLDIGMPAGTWLYSPVEGTVRIAGGVPAYTYYGNWEPYVGQLLIVTDAGDEVVLGHMGRIAVGVGERVSVGQFVGTSGGFNGDHLHLEVREAQQGGWLLAVDPRRSTIVDSLAAAATETPSVEMVNTSN